MGKVAEITGGEVKEVTGGKDPRVHLGSAMQAQVG